MNQQSRRFTRNLSYRTGDRSMLGWRLGYFTLFVHLTIRYDGLYESVTLGDLPSVQAGNQPSQYAFMNIHGSARPMGHAGPSNMCIGTSLLPTRW